jgi:hypothetical protein
MQPLELDLELEERRHKRSSDPLIALHYQLSVVRSQAELEAIVVADPSGTVVAGAGAWATCEELAAYAPLLVQTEAPHTFSSRVEALRRDAVVHALDVDGQEIFLCARGGSDLRGPSVARAAEGISRILRAG